MPKIYQIYYRAEQRRFLDPNCVPYFNEDDPNAELAEFSVFHREYLAKTLFSEEYIGFISWRFTEKTKIAIPTFTEFIESNPGYDVYFVNPYLCESLLFRNVWTHGEKRHPGLLNLSQEIFERAGYRINLRKMILDPDAVGYCNYWVGNSRFWDLYMNFCEPILEVINNKLSPSEKRLIEIANYFRPSSFHPFIMERLFSTVLKTKKGIRFLRYCPEGYPDLVYGDLVPHFHSAERVSKYFRKSPSAQRESVLNDFASLYLEMIDARRPPMGDRHFRDSLVGQRVRGVLRRMAGK